MYACHYHLQLHVMFYYVMFFLDTVHMNFDSSDLSDNDFVSEDTTYIPR